jgi:soluble lytic murein transglycosylase-like protein
MGAIGTTIVRGLPAGLICGAALWATASAPAAFAQATRPVAHGMLPQDLAAMPRTTSGDPLPHPLSPADAQRYRRIFHLQERGDFAAADRDIRALSDPLLLGHVQADRLLGPHHRATWQDLAAWFSQYADHPDAQRVHALLVARLPRGTPVPQPPSAVALPPMPEVENGTGIEEALAATTRTALERNVRDRARAGDARGALLAIERARVDAETAAALRGEVAHALFLLNRDSEALLVARQAGDAAFLPAFAGGLAAIRLDRPAEALGLFTSAHAAPGAQPAQKAAAAFWAARAALRARQPRLYAPWLMEAAQSPRSFYGLVARRALGLSPGFAWDPDTLGGHEASLLAETGNGLRALALLQINERDRAEGELALLAPRAAANPALARAMVAVANNSRMPSLAARLSGLAQSADGRPRDFARFPLPGWTPEGGFRADPALLYALARVESNFVTGAVSPAGARGPMQIMPRTAAYVTGRPGLAGPERGRLHEPAFSLKVGQQYLAYLARHESTGGDLILTLAAYNAGPGSLARWLPSVNHKGDPLIFLEAIPNAETRAHVQRVLALKWIYASRLNLGSESLDMIAAGRWPRYQDGAPELAEISRN